MSLASVKVALETALKAGISPMTIAWENVEFTPPVDGSAFAVCSFLPASPENPTLGDSFYREVGLMQVMLCYPLNQGAGRVYAQAELVRSLFPRGSTATAGGITVTISRTPTIAQIGRQDEKFVAVVRIPYWADVFSG